MQKPEFKVGDQVTYAPYEKELPCEVKAIEWYYSPNGTRPRYRLKGEMVNAASSAKCIKESKFFVPYKP